MRDKRIYTIDPFTSRDLDDTLSAEILSNGNILIGVHIADVSSYIVPGTEIDKEAMARGTSFYLPGEVVHMLPTSLSSGDCSLLPGTDKLCVSLLAIFTPTGDLVDIWCGETVIRSRSKLSYDVVDMLLEKYDKKQELPKDFGFVPKELYDPLLGPQQVTIQELTADLVALRSISRVLREKRQRYSFINTELQFNLVDATEKFGDQEMTYPKPVSLKEIEATTESHLMVEDFMVFANEIIANFTTRIMPRESVIRYLSQPDDLDEVFTNFDMTSIQSLKESITELRENCASQYGPFKYFDGWVSDVLLGNFNAALYGNPGGMALKEIKKNTAKENIVNRILADYRRISGRTELTKEEADKIIGFLQVYFPPESEKLLFGHFALGSYLYIHFTSPIRRYVDIVAHRLLAHATYIYYAQKHGLLTKKKFTNANMPGDIYPSKTLFQDFMKSAALPSPQDPSAFTFPLFSFPSEPLPFKEQNAIALSAIKEEIEKEEAATNGTQYFDLDFGFVEKVYKKMPNPGELSVICAQCNKRHADSRNIEQQLNRIYLATIYNKPFLADLYISELGYSNDAVTIKGFFPVLNKSFNISFENCHSMKLVELSEGSPQTTAQQTGCALAANNELVVKYLKNPDEKVIDIGYDDEPNPEDINYVINSIFNKERRKANHFLDKVLKRNKDGSVLFQELHNYFLLKNISDDEEVWKAALKNSAYIDVLDDRIAPKPLPEPECITVRYQLFECITVKASVKYTPFAHFEFAAITPHDDISALAHAEFDFVK